MGRGTVSEVCLGKLALPLSTVWLGGLLNSKSQLSYLQLGIMTVPALQEWEGNNVRKYKG